MRIKQPERKEPRHLRCPVRAVLLPWSGRGAGEYVQGAWTCQGLELRLRHFAGKNEIGSNGDLYRPNSQDQTCMKMFQQMSAMIDENTRNLFQFLAHKNGRKRKEPQWLLIIECNLVNKWFKVEMKFNYRRAKKVSSITYLRRKAELFFFMQCPGQDDLHRVHFQEMLVCFPSHQWQVAQGIKVKEE